MSHIQLPIALMRITQFSFRQPQNLAQLVPTISSCTPSITGVLAFFGMSVLVEFQPDGWSDIWRVWEKVSQCSLNAPLISIEIYHY
jgi:hypothetical protein